MSTPRRLDVHSAVQRADVETARGRFATWACEPQGSALPRGQVVLVPGFTGSKEDFGPMLPLLAAASWRVLAYDQRGQYESTATDSDDFTLAGFAADLISLTDAALGTDEQVHLVGHSFGGLVAREAALIAPSRWASVTLMCSGPGALEGDERADLLAAAEAVLQDGLESTYLAKRQRDLDRGIPEPEPMIEEFLHTRFLANSAHSLSAIARLLSETPDRTADLASLGIPIAVIRGEHDDGWPHVVQDQMAKALGTSVQVVDDAAHSPAVEQPERTRDALARVFMS